MAYGVPVARSTRSSGSPDPGCAGHVAIADFDNSAHAAFPALAILVGDITGALAGPLCATAAAALFLTSVGMWVARISQSLLTASLAAVTGILFTAGAVFYYATVEPDAQGRTQRQDPVGAAPRFGGADLRWADLRRVDGVRIVWPAFAPLRRVSAGRRFTDMMPMSGRTLLS